MGHDVTVISSVPHYPSGSVMAEFRGRLISSEQLNGVHVVRVWVPSVNRANLWQRLLTFLSYQFLASLAGLRLRYDLVLGVNPGLEVFLPFLVLGILRRKPRAFSVQDIYPDVGVKLGVFKQRWLIRTVDLIERACLSQSGYIHVISESFRQHFLAKGYTDSQLRVIPNWTDTDFILPVSRTNSFSVRWSLNDCFVVMYAGNLGLSQGLEHVLESASLLHRETAIRFVFVGDGPAKTTLQERADSTGLTNIQFIPFQRRALLPQVLASADVSLVTLNRNVVTESVPSKCYSILASGRPIIASVDEHSETFKLIRDSGGGLCVLPENPEALANAICQLYRDRHYNNSLGAKGRAYVVHNHSRIGAAREFQRMLCSILSIKPRAI